MNAINLLGLEPQRWIMSSDIPTLSPVDHNSRLMVVFRRWLRLLRLLSLSAHVRHLRTIYKASTPWTGWHGTRHDGKALLRWCITAPMVASNGDPSVMILRWWLDSSDFNTRTWMIMEKERRDEQWCIWRKWGVQARERTTQTIWRGGEGFEIDEDINTFVYLYKATINKT